MSERHSHGSSSTYAAAIVAALLSSSVASAATHQPNYTPIVVAVSVVNPSFNGTPNTMMYSVTATVDDTFDDASHEGVVGFTTETGCGDTVAYTWSPEPQVFNRRPTRTWTLYNFQPGVAYHYAVRTGAAGSYQYSCGDLGIPTIPASLEDLGLVVDNSSGAYSTRYVMFDTDGCDGTNYMVAVDADTGNIVWYLDTEALTGVPEAEINGWRFLPRGTRFVQSDRMLVTIDIAAERRRELLYEVELDGTVVNAKDFNQPDGGPTDVCNGSDGSAGPCPHHDAFKSDRTGKTWVIVSAASGTGIDGNPFWTPDVCTAPPYEFLTDGFQVLDRDYAELSTSYLHPDLGYDPAVDGGPAAPSHCAATGDWSATLDPNLSWLDWFHVNTIVATPDDRFVDLSIRNWSQVIRVRADGSSTAPVWTLSGDRAYSDFGTIAMGPDVAVGTATFDGQHDVHFIDEDTLVLYDNKGVLGSAPDTYETRVLRMGLTFGRMNRSATIEKSWALASNDGTLPLSCPTRGSGQLVPGDPDSVLALCHAEFVIEELNDSSGALAAPSLYIGLDTPPEDACIASGLEVDGFYRAYPLDHLGDF